MSKCALFSVFVSGFVCVFVCVCLPVRILPCCVCMYVYVYLTVYVYLYSIFVFVCLCVGDTYIRISTVHECLSVFLSAVSICGVVHACVHMLAMLCVPHPFVVHSSHFASHQTRPNSIVCPIHFKSFKFCSLCLWNDHFDSGRDSHRAVCTCILYIPSWWESDRI